MQLIDGRLVVSPSDLTGYLACEHLTQLELAAARGEGIRPERSDPELELVSQRGLEHEAAQLARFKARGLRVVEITLERSTIDAYQQAEARTRRAMEDGVDVIYQGTFFDGRWLCRTDFLLRIDKPSRLGLIGYEVADAKLALKAKARALLQLCAYAEQLERIQGIESESVRLILGDGHEETYRLKDYAAYYRSVKARFEATVYGPAVVTYPNPVEHCSVCRWFNTCDRRRRDDDHLCLVASMRSDQTQKLTTAGITTVVALASSPDRQPVQGIGVGALARLRRQARLQVLQRETGAVRYELLPPPGANLGLAALPPPSGGDLFFDMEGDPFVDGRLEYLFGVLEVVDDKPLYHKFWGHDHAGEKRAFEEFMDLVMDRLARDPELHIYHYASYEPTALKRLMGTHATRENEVDRLLRGGVLVDLYQVLRQSLLVSQESYSLKKLEPLFRAPRSTQITDAVDSMVAYKRWLDTADASILEQIAEYNEDDCLSTGKLRDWLEMRRLEAESRFGAIARPLKREAAPSEQLATVEAETAALAAQLLATVPEQRDRRGPEQQARWLLAHLLNWHRREAKSEWWDYYQRLRLTDEELREDHDAISGLAYEGVVGKVKRSLVHRYRFDPAQEYKIGEGDHVVNPRTEEEAGLVVRLDPVEGILDLKRGERSTIGHPTAVVPGKPINTTELRRGLRRVGEWVLANGISGPGPYRAVRDLLCLSFPRITNVSPGMPLQSREEKASDLARRCILELDDSYLAIQGPPGSGKTWIGARMIVDLVQAGKRVGITAISHKAINNLLAAVCDYAGEVNAHVRVLQKADETQRCQLPTVHCTNENGEVARRVAAGEVDIVAGTPFLFAREELMDQLDTLFVDEAGQMSLANVIAMAGSYRNLVLLGDPNQLAYPTHGVHPPAVDGSALDHVIDGHTTLRPERGIFLAVTYRMHPRVCRFVSEVFYEGRLEPAAGCAGQALSGTSALAGVGLRYLPVLHKGNRTLSSEEAGTIATEVRGLMGSAFTDQDGHVKPLEIGDQLVVAPYNAQVRRLVEKLGWEARVGTVDKFQGQQAPVLFYSMATSSAEDAPRGMDFLYSLNRLNVAVSRAQVLAVLVASPELLKVRCRTAYQMRLANALCRFAEVASERSR